MVSNVFNKQRDNCLNSYCLPFLISGLESQPWKLLGWQVDQAILSEEDRVVVIRFGHDWDPVGYMFRYIEYKKFMLFFHCLDMYEDGRGFIQHCRKGQKLCSYLLGKYDLDILCVPIG